MRESTPHLYLSAMPQTPSSSPLRQLWVNHLQNHLSVTLGHPLSWPAEVLTLQGHTSVTSVAYSPDGSHIVSGSEDNTIRVWNPTTGQCIAGPFQGHTSWVSSVAYSPDGSHIVSGSWDNTIRVWNPTTGQCIAGPFQGHTHWVTSVAYSPDGSHIVSGSWDNTIRVWNPTTGQCIAGPFQGHTSLSPLLPIHLMAVILSLAQRTTPLGFGIQPLVSV
jgi:WD40 repeat protein